MSMNALEQAKRDAVNARGRLEMTVSDVQRRMRPGTLAGEAWDGVKSKSADLAGDALQAVKKRPGAVSAVIGVLALFLARGPIKRAVTSLASRKRKGIERDDPALNAKAT